MILTVSSSVAARDSSTWVVRLGLHPHRPLRDVSHFLPSITRSEKLQGSYAILTGESALAPISVSHLRLVSIACRVLKVVGADLSDQLRPSVLPRRTVLLIYFAISHDSNRGARSWTQL